MALPLRVLVGDPRQGAIFRFDKPSVTVGSAQTNDLVLPDPRVIPQYARVDYEGERGPRYAVRTLRTGNTAYYYEEQPFRIGPYELRMLEREPPDAEERAFLDVLERGPADDDTRTVYADWLEEKGRAREAEFLRAQITIRTLSDVDPEFPRLSRRVQEIGPELSTSWRRTVARPAVENCRVRLEVTCPKAWDKMKPTANPDERHCGACNRIVYYARTVADAQMHAMRGHCIAVDVARRRLPGDLAAPVPMMTAGMPMPMPPK